MLGSRGLELRIHEGQDTAVKLINYVVGVEASVLHRHLNHSWIDVHHGVVRVDLEALEAFVSLLPGLEQVFFCAEQPGIGLVDKSTHLLAPVLVHRLKIKITKESD